MFRIQRESLKHYFDNMSKEREHVVIMNSRRNPVLHVQIRNEVVNDRLHERRATIKKLNSYVEATKYSTKTSNPDFEQRHLLLIPRTL
jgi:tRNA(Ile2) C34 agmatinyltransferase TiaS